MIWNVDPILLSLGPLTIRWYGLLFVLGFLIGFQIVKKMFVRDRHSVELLDSLLVHVMLGTIIGARLGHCFFYEPAYFFSHPLEIFAVWKGGLASHGGFLGVFIAIVLFCRRYALSFFYVLDRVSIIALLTGGLIRIGNLMNSEIIGRPTDVPWAFTFTRVDQLPRHPTQIYESLSYLLISLVAWLIEKRKGARTPAGLLFGFILTFGFAARFVLEFFKENQEPFEKDLALNMGQLLSLVPIAFGLFFLVLSLMRQPASIEPVMNPSPVSGKKKKAKNK